MHDTSDSSREWLLPSEVVGFTGWVMLNAPDVDEGYYHWASPDDIPSEHDSLINSLITEQ
jgi:hypothetical protein